MPKGPSATAPWGVSSAVLASGGALGMLAGGLLTQYASWRWVLFVNVPLGILVLAATPRVVAAAPGKPRARLDVAGAVAVTTGLAALVWSSRQVGRCHLPPRSANQGAIMSTFSSAELAYLRGERRLARLATVGPDGTPHITPVGMWSVDPDSGVVEVTGHDFAATKKFRDVARTHRAAIVVDDVLPPWRPRGVEIRGRAEAVSEPRPAILIHPERIIGWGLDDHGPGHRRARDVDPTA